MTTLTYAGRAAARWLGDLRRTGSFEESDLEELGSHLEDETGQLMDGGLSEKEAFWVAMGRVGNGDDLPPEYAKTNTWAVWRHRFWWMAAGLLGYLGFNYLVQHLFYEATMLAGSAGADGVPLLAISLLLMIAVNGAALFLAWRLLPGIGASRTGSRFQRIRQGWKGTVLLYLLCVGTAVALVILGLWTVMPHPDFETAGAAYDEYIKACIIFTAVFAVALVSAAFWVSRPPKAPDAAASRPAHREGQGGTKRPLWAVAAAVCLIAPVAAAAAIVIPGLGGSGPIIPEGHALMTPAHWWRAELNEEQMATLSASWGKPMTVAELLDQLWPGVLQEMPEQARTVYANHGINWPPEGYENWDRSSFMCAGSGAPSEEGPRLYDYYVGSRDWEEMTLVEPTDRGLAEERMYRVSLYIGEPAAQA